MIWILNHRFLIYAHRGASLIRPENTIPAFRAAVRLGANGIEFDVQLTRDGYPVIIHDYTLNRTTNGSGKVSSYTLEQIKQLSAGAWFDKKYESVRVPTVEEVLKLVRKTDIFVNIELKNFPIKQPGMEERVTELIEKYKLYEQAVLSTFLPSSLNKINKLNPHIMTAFLYFGKLD